MESRQAGSETKWSFANNDVSARRCPADKSFARAEDPIFAGADHAAVVENRLSLTLLTTEKRQVEDHRSCPGRDCALEHSRCGIQ